LVFVAAVALIDALYIFLASIGMASILENNIFGRSIFWKSW
jgi:hypothetical protein